MKHLFIALLLIVLVGGGCFTTSTDEQVQTTTEETSTMIEVDTPRPNTIITSPLTISGQAKGTWFFEGSFPIVLTDWDGIIIAQGYATATEDWMTEDFVPFTAEIEFGQPVLYNQGALILQKDNPSGLPEYDDSIEIPIFYW